MRQDQTIRAVGIVAVVALLASRLIAVGNGEIPFFGFAITPFGLAVVAVFCLALPEVIDMIPVGPTRDRPEEKDD